MLQEENLREYARKTGLDLERETFTISTPRPIPYKIVKDFIEISLKRLKKEGVLADFAGSSKSSDHWHIRLSLKLDKEERKDFKSCIEYLASKRFSSYYKQEDKESKEKIAIFSALFKYEIHNFDSYVEHRGHGFIKHLVKV